MLLLVIKYDDANKAFFFKYIVNIYEFQLFLFFFELVLCSQGAYPCRCINIYYIDFKNQHYYSRLKTPCFKALFHQNHLNPTPSVN